jgi:hypothetical protein
MRPGALALALRIVELAPDPGLVALLGEQPGDRGDPREHPGGAAKGLEAAS